MSKVVGEIQGLVLRLGLSAVRRSHGLTCVTDPPPRILVIAPAGPTRYALQAILLSAGWKATFADTTDAGLLWQCNEPFPMVLLEHDSLGRPWPESISLLARTESQPCVILIAGAVDSNLRDEVYRRGGYEVMKTPIQEDSALRLLQAGWALWRNQVQLRRLGSRDAVTAVPFTQ